MGVFEELGLFVRFGQCIGQFPYRLEKDPLRGGLFKCFNFSLCHPVTFWCILISAFQIGIFTWSLIASYNYLQQEMESSKMPVIFSYITAIASLDSFVMLILVRAITYRYHRLEIVVNSLSAKNIRALEVWENVLPNCKTVVKKMTIVGISLILIIV
jgi:hypothetical protein